MIRSARVSIREGDLRHGYVVKDLEYAMHDGRSLTLVGKVVAHEARDDSCLACGLPDAYQAYAVLDEVWAQTGYGKDAGCMHLWCLERKIGRRIKVEDLKDATWNDLIKHVMEAP